ncbi:c-type cytochrome [Arcobacter sp.]|uniref:c-type cytochrome n=1 Tax=Arcobacter sp. TaxID=1872629 RepID=UPI003D13FD48
MQTLTKILVVSSILGLTSLMANDGAVLYKACASCHGQNAEKAALGKSQIIQGWEKEKVISALNGYKDGSYGGAMKGVMKGQVSKLDDKKIDALATYISTLK